MKKTIVFLLVLALAVPSIAMAATEFSLGGFIKLDAFWDSTQGAKNMNSVPARTNDPNFNHGRMKFTAQGSRFNFTIKGPEIFGAKTTGFMEIDFDPSENPGLNGIINASNVYTPRVRHAMFRFNWPSTELLLGQYWSMFCEWYIEAAEDGPFQLTGTPTARLAQIRLSQTFGNNDWTISALVGEATGINVPGANFPFTANISNNGEAAETPQVQGKLRYAHDWWGKAPYYGVPTPFTAQVTAGWQRNVLRGGLTNNATVFTGLGQNVFTAPTGFLQQNYVSPWMVMGTLFIPVIPTYTKDVSGTAHLLTQWWIGRGVEAFGFTGSNTQLFKFNNNFFNLRMFDVELLQRFGGLVEGQYYFNNRWFANLAWGMTKTYGVNQNLIGSNIFATNPGGAVVNPAFSTVFLADQPKYIWQLDATLWYRPIQAIKFGLQYSYVRSYFMETTFNPAVFGTNAAPTNTGHEHRVEFAGYFFF